MIHVYVLKYIYQQEMENATEAVTVVEQDEQREVVGQGQPQNPPPLLRRRFIIFLYVGYFLAR